MIKSIITNIKELRKPCVEAQKGEDISAVVQDLKDTLATQKGCGLAANQIGVQKKIAFYKIGPNEVTLINPKITDKYDKTIFTEGCLSFPGLEIKTDRYREITLENNNQRYGASGIEAIVIQHEVDHLNGVTIFDRKHKAR